MQLFKFTGDGVDGAVAFTFGTTDTTVVDFEGEELAAGACGTFLVTDVSKVFILEVAQSTQNRVGCCLTETAESSISNGFGEVFEIDKHFFSTVTVADFFEHFEHAAGTDTAGSAFTAGFIFGKVQIELRHRGHTIVVRKHDHTAGTHH